MSTRLTSVYSAPSYCSLNPSIAAWGVGSGDLSLTTIPLTTVVTYTDTTSTYTTDSSTITQGPSVPQWIVGSNQFLEQCEPSAGVWHFSPGVCPQNWTPAAISSNGSFTSAVCCPTGFAASASATYCTAIVTSPIALYTGDSGVQTQSFDAQSVTTITDGILSHYGNFYVTWASSDLPLFTPASAPLFMKEGTAFNPFTSTSTSSMSTPTSTSTQTSTGNPNPGLSTGAKAGIGIGAAVGGLLLIGAAIFLTFRLGKRRGKTDLVNYDSGFETQQRQSLQPELYDRG